MSSFFLMTGNIHTADVQIITWPFVSVGNRSHVFEINGCNASIRGCRLFVFIIQITKGNIIHGEDIFDQKAALILIVNVCHRFGVFNLICEATDSSGNIFGSDIMTLCQV